MSPILTHNSVALNTLFEEPIYRISNSGGREPVEGLTDMAGPPDYLGSNKKNILFVVHDSIHSYFSPDSKDAFMKTLAALKLGLDDIAVFNICDTEFHSFDTLRTLFEPKKIVFLGCPSSIIPIQSIALNTPVIVNSIELIHTDAFDVMLQNKNKKKSFWAAMKQMFTPNA